MNVFFKQHKKKSTKPGRPLVFIDSINFLK